MSSQSISQQSLVTSFKRQYHRVRKVFVKLAESDSFSWQFKYDKNGISIQNTIPNEEVTIQFTVLMRPFLNPSDALYYKAVWTRLKDHFAEIITPEVIYHLDTTIEQLNKGFVSINIYGQDLTAETNYNTIANGDYFGKTDKEALAFLESLADVPVSSLLLHQFYTYNVDILYVISMLFDVILTVEKDERSSIEAGEGTPTDKRCIFCLSDAGPFTDDEHTVPEALGNYYTVLPKGYVCKTCNNQVLSRLDNALAESDLLAFLRTLFVPFTKAGKLPEAHFQNTVIKKVAPTHIRITDQTNRDSIIIDQKNEDGTIKFTLKMVGRNKFDPKIIGRALYKIGLEMVAFHQGRAAVCDSKYDTARAFILKGEDFPNNLLMRTRIMLNPVIRSQIIPTVGTCCELHIYGLVFIFNLEKLPVLELAEQLSRADFVSLPLYYGQFTGHSHTDS